MIDGLRSRSRMRGGRVTDFVRYNLSSHSWTSSWTVDQTGPDNLHKNGQDQNHLDHSYEGVRGKDLGILSYRILKSGDLSL